MRDDVIIFILQGIIYKMNLLGLALILIYLIIQFIYTQKIYVYNYFFRLLALGIIFLIVSMFSFTNDSLFLKISFGLLIFYYAGLLFLIKKVYRKLNTLLVAKGFINKRYLDKDFTYINWNSKNPTSPDWWDEKLAKNPSWFDKLLSCILLLLPFEIFWLINFCYE
jgi:hypothetical protein